MSDQLTKQQRKAIDKLTDAICAHWRLSDAQREIVFQDLTPARFRVLVDIYAALRALFECAKCADAWVHKPNSEFGDKAAIELILSGQEEELLAVQRHLNSYIHGQYF